MPTLRADVAVSDVNLWNRNIYLIALGFFLCFVRSSSEQLSSVSLYVCRTPAAVGIWNKLPAML